MCIGSLITDDTTAERLSRNPSQNIIRTDLRHMHIFIQIDHIGSDASADIIPALYALRLDRKFTCQHFFRCIQSECSSGAVTICIDPSADQCIMHIDGSILIIEPGNSADVILTDHNAGNGFYGNCLTCIREFDPSVIVSGNSACIVRSCLPVFHDHVVDRAVVI